uniref:Acyl-peptide hydrolase n=1 Tax=Rhabditophanes sp. KR3021 TaxID=114890 RepID=A0AC35TJ79_9BILA
MSTTDTKIVAPFGSWQSPIDTTILTAGNCKGIVELQIDNDHLFWVEATFPKGFRTLYSAPIDALDKVTQWTNGNQNVAESIHEYGGGASKIKDGKVFISQKNQILLLTTPQQDGKELVDSSLHQDKLKIRHADFDCDSKYVYAVREQFVQGKSVPDNLIVSINIDTKEESIIGSGNDFYAVPRVSPNGKYISYMTWKIPNMSWDNTTIVVAELSNGKIGKVISTFERNNINYQSFQWSKAEGEDIEFFYIHDRDNFWDLYKVNINPETLHINERKLTAGFDVGSPLWILGSERTFAVSDKLGLIAYDKKNGELEFQELMDFSKKVVMNDKVYSNFGYFNFGKDGLLYTIASGPGRKDDIISIDPVTLEIKVIRQTLSSSELIGLPISEPTKTAFQTDDGTVVEGYFYPPCSNKYEAPAGTLPPVLFLGHGGPTGNTTNALDFKKQFYTSRGFAVFDINYRGSTSRGKSFRDSLKLNWGVRDKIDVIYAAKYLIKAKMVDPEKVSIYGTSAGGFLVLSALIDETSSGKGESPLFSAGVCVYGVADLIALNGSDHKFESHYNDQLIAVWPSGEAVYQERSPINHIQKLVTPTLFMHGLQDTVINFEQSVKCHQILKKNNVMTGLILFEGEGHGFVKSETVKRSTEASYYFLCKAMGIVPGIQNDDLVIDNSK